MLSPPAICRRGHRRRPRRCKTCRPGGVGTDCRGRALPVKLDLLTAGAFSNTNLARLLDACNEVSRLDRLRVAFDVSVTPGGLTVVGQLPALTCLRILVTDEKRVGCFIKCPILGLTHPGVSMSSGVRPQHIRGGRNLPTALFPPHLSG